MIDKTKLPTAKKIQEELSKATSIEDFFGRDGIMSRLFAKSLESMMEEELTQSLGYKRHEQTDSSNARNGTYKRKLTTSFGPTDIEIPRDRLNEYEPKAIQKYQTRSSEFEEKILGMYARGMTTRDIHDHLLDLYGTDISADLISGITDKIIPLAKEWQQRPLSDVYVIVYLDAIHVKLRVNGKVDSRAVYLALGIDLEGHKDLLGMYVSEQAEGANFWLSVLSDLQIRGVRDIFITCVDGLTGFKDAIKATYPDTIIQRCIIHQIRNTLKYVSWKDKKAFMHDLQLVYKAPNEEAAIDAFAKLKDIWGKEYAIAIRSWENNWDDLSSFYHFPIPIRRLMYTTNIIESFNHQLRKVTKTKSIFPTPDSVLKIFFLALQNIEKKWTMPIPNWAIILNQLAIRFEGRFSL